jgi:hypothetical protein
MSKRLREMRESESERHRDTERREGGREGEVEGERKGGRETCPQAPERQT